MVFAGEGEGILGHIKFYAKLTTTNKGSLGGGCGSFYVPIFGHVFFGVSEG